MAPARTSIPLGQSTFVVLDVETTGLSPAHDHVIEIAALRLRHGGIAETFQTLIDPGVGVPLEITRLTGLTDGALHGQPRFEQVVEPLLAFLDADPLVAHNALFDYSFVREECRRAGYAYTARTFCTARLGRRLLPALRRQSLDALLRALGIEAPDRHRAASDAQATAAAFLALLPLAEAEGARTPSALYRLQSPARRSQHDDLATGIRQMPNAPGVYCFRDVEGRVVYVGKARDLRRRVQSHFQPSTHEPHRLRRVMPTVEAIEHIDTGSELEALLLESKLIKHYLPSGNQAQRDYHQYPYLRLDTDADFPRLAVSRSVAADGATYYGPFRRSSTVQAAVEELQQHFRLPRCDGPIVPGQTPICLYGQMGRCLAPCVGRVSVAEYQGVIGQLQQFLLGSGELLDHLERRRDALAEELRFEEAARLRDAADELRVVFGAQRTLSAAIHQCHLVVVAPSTAVATVELFAIREGLLAEQRRVTAAISEEELTSWLMALYAGRAPPRPAVRNDELDELHIIASWLRREEGHHLRVPVDPADPAASARPLVQAIAGFDLFTASPVGQSGGVSTHGAAQASV